MKFSGVKISWGVFALFVLAGACRKEEQEIALAPLVLAPASAIPGHYIVLLKSDILSDQPFPELPAGQRPTARYGQARLEHFKPLADAVLSACGIPSVRVEEYYMQVFTGFAIELSALELELLRRHPMVEMLEQDMEVSLPENRREPDDPHLRAQTVPCGITNAGGPADGSESTKWCWIVDSGIDLDHPDLNVVTDPTYAKSFAGGTPDDCNGHGTHCAGIVAAIDNTMGVVGVSAGAPVVPVRVLDCNATGRTSKIIKGLDHVALYDEPGDVVNYSITAFWGNNCESNSSYVAAMTALSNSGTRVAIAAGNYTDQASLYTPACINAANLHTVASMSCGKFWSSFSNYGAPPIDWIATGSSVYSTYLNGGYATLSGTSMATPHVTGIMHSLQSSPNQNGTVDFNGTSYKIASR